MPYLVFDIETLVDSDLHDPPADDEKKDAFPPIPACRPIVIGCVLLADDLSPLKIGATRFPADHGAVSDKLEVDMLTSWSSWVASRKPTLVSWYGRGFDLPVIVARCLRHGICLPWYTDDSRYRYSTKYHIDLCDQLSEYGAVRNAKLDIYARAIGLPGKYGFDGSMVADAYKNGGYERIVDYCITDCLQTAWVLQRWMLTRGVLSPDGYKERARALLDLTRKHDSEAIQEFASYVDEKRLLLED